MYAFSAGNHLWLLHGLSCLIFLTGLVLFLVWLVQYLMKKKRLLSWGIILLIIGLLGLIISFQLNFLWGPKYLDQNRFPAMYQFMYGNNNSADTSNDFGQQMFDEMQEHMELE